MHGGEGRGERGGFGGHGRGGGPGGHHGGHHGGPGGRARRGEVKFLLLDALQSGPKHGYEIIKAMEERSGGNWAPSPGTVYPTLQFLEDAGLVRAEQSGDRRVFHLTETGQAEIAAHAEEVTAFWARFAAPAAPAARAETSFVQEELQFLNRTIWGGLHRAEGDANVEVLRRIRQAIEGCRNEVRRILAEAGTEEA